MTETNRIEFKRELMRVFRDVEMVESLGSGMNRIMRIYGRENFEFGGNYIRMIVPCNWIPAFYVLIQVIFDIFSRDFKSIR